MSPARRTLLRRAAWALLLLPGISQLVLLCTAMFSRMRYPYDLEWMEGGLLDHAQRIADGQGIYVAPSIDFIPYLYTPLYPGFIAMTSGMFGISYTVGRIISILSTLGVLVLFVAMLFRDTERRDRSFAWLGACVAAGFFAATYPWVEGWYDLVRADSLFLFMVVGGLLGVRNWARAPGQNGLVKLGCAALVLALAFFAKQTAILFVASGGVLVLVLNWRRVPLYVAVTGTIGLGGTWLLNRATGGWFWVYIFEQHQNHDFNMKRFKDSFGYMLWKFPAMTLVIVAGLLAVAVTFAIRRRLPASCKALLLWTPFFAVGVIIGAIGWGTEFAHFNAYIPGMTFGALCAGAAVVALVACVRELVAQRPEHPNWAQLGGRVAGAALGAQLVVAWWNPGHFIPPSSEEKAGNELVRRIRDAEGEVFIPYHPWYARLAGKETYVHFMGLRDMGRGKRWSIDGLQKAWLEQRFAMIVLDNRDLGSELAGLRSHYRLDDQLPPEASPHVFTGAGAVWNKKVQVLVPRDVWVPDRPLEVPDGATVLWDFEDGSFQGWKREGAAFGTGPIQRSLNPQNPVRRYGGRYFVSSYHGQDKSVGKLRSPPFVIRGSRITFRLSGGSDKARVRAELWVEGKLEKSSAGRNNEGMEEVTWNVAPHAGKTARIVLIDENQGSWGHLSADEFWMWE